MPTRSLAGRIVGVLGIAVLLAGCQTLGGARLIVSTVTTDLMPEAARAIADDMAAHLAGQVGPGTATLALTPDGSEFGRAVEASLKATGYGIVTDQTAGQIETIPLAYVVDDFEGSVLVRLSMQHVELTRVYKLSQTGAEPVSPLSVMARAGGGP